MLSTLRAIWVVPGLRRVVAGLALALALWAIWAWLSGTLRAQGARSAAAAATQRLQRAEHEAASLRAELEAARETARRNQEIADALATFNATRHRLDDAATAARRSLDAAAAEFRAAASPAAQSEVLVGPDAMVDPALAGALRDAVERLRHAADSGTGGRDSQGPSAASATD